MERKNAWKKYTEEEKAAVFAYGDEYRQFISDCKTERECVTELKKRAIAAGFQDMEAVIAKGITLTAYLQITKGKVLPCTSLVRSQWKMA